MAVFFREAAFILFETEQLPHAFEIAIVLSKFFHNLSFFVIQMLVFNSGFEIVVKKNMDIFILRFGFLFVTFLDLVISIFLLFVNIDI